MINALKKLRHKHAFKKGYKSFLENGITPKEAYVSMRRLFVLSRGKSNDDISSIISKKIGKYDAITPSGVLGDLSTEEMSQMVVQMRHDGYYIFKNSLNDDMVKTIYEFAISEPTEYLNVENGNYSGEKKKFDPKNIISPRYQFSSDSIMKNESLQKLIFDTSLLAFAQEYLGCKPILDLIAFWWSAPYHGKGLSEAAQMYHFDLDRLKFIKFFFYITDVDVDTGPHCYVKGSHKHLPEALARDGRFTDEEVESIYGRDKMTEICGKKGSIIAVDTRGFHKGKELKIGNRLLFQIEFANSMFGQSYPKVKFTPYNHEIGKTLTQYPYSYNQFFDINGK